MDPLDDADGMTKKIAEILFVFVLFRLLGRVSLFTLQLMLSAFFISSSTACKRRKITLIIIFIAVCVCVFGCSGGTVGEKNFKSFEII